MLQAIMLHENYKHLVHVLCPQTRSIIDLEYYLCTYF